MSLKLHPDADQIDARLDAKQGKSSVSTDTRSPAEPSSKALASAQEEDLPSQAETLDYLLALTIQIKKMAQRGGFRRLGLILMLAEQEARQQMLSSGSPPPTSLR